MPRLDTLSEVVRQVLVAFPCVEHETAPWTPLGQPLGRATVALVTTAGLHRRGDRPFVSDLKGGDQSYRVIPSDTRAADLLQSHVSIGFDHTAFYRDMNVTFPLDRLHELARGGTIGAVAPQAYSFMGAIRNPQRLVTETGPEVAARLHAEGAQVVLLTPT